MDASWTTEGLNVLSQTRDLLQAEDELAVSLVYGPSEHVLNASGEGISSYNNQLQMLWVCFTSIAP